jgi:site-specific DNA-adenine methylase
MGSKQKYRDVLLDFTQKTNKLIYVEPFLGSGYLFLNVLDEFNEFHIADIDSNILNMFTHFIYNKDITLYDKLYNDFYFSYNPNTYDGFYKLRNYYNSNLWGTSSIEEAFCLVVLISCTINSMYRFGKSGYNASFGNRYFTPIKFNRFKDTCRKLSSLNKPIFLYNNYYDCLLNKSGSFQFIDPPYILREMSNHNNFQENDLISLLNMITSDNDVVYTDIRNKYGDSIFNKITPLTKTASISPNRGKEFSLLDEVLYSNF